MKKKEKNRHNLQDSVDAYNQMFPTLNWDSHPQITSQSHTVHACINNTYSQLKLYLQCAQRKVLGSLNATDNSEDWDIHCRKRERWKVKQHQRLHGSLLSYTVKNILIPPSTPMKNWNQSLSCVDPCLVV